MRWQGSCGGGARPRKQVDKRNKKATLNSQRGFSCVETGLAPSKLQPGQPNNRARSNYILTHTALVCV